MISGVMDVKVVQIVGVPVLLLVGGVGCVSPSRCPVAGSPLSDRRAAVHAGALSIDDSRSAQRRIVVARVRLAAGTPLRTSLLRVIPWPANLKWSGHLRPVDLVHFAGRHLRRDIPPGAPVTRGDLEGSGASARSARVRVPPGGRTVTLRVDWVGGVGTWVRRGDWVDVAVVAREPRRRQLTIRMLMQSAQVVAAEQWVVRGALRTWRPWCTLLALPQEAQALALAQRLGRIVIFRRSNRDRRRVVYQPVTRRNLVSPRFWRALRRHRLRTIQRHGFPDDPGFGGGYGAGLRTK